MSASELARPFVPMRLLARFSGDTGAASMPGAVLVADLTDFTGLTEALAQLSGTAGGELLSRELHQALAPAVNIVMQCGGDVVKFAGDGLLCVFPGSDAVGAERAAREIAGIELRGPTGTFHRFRLVVTYGVVTLIQLSGTGGRRELVAGGDAVERAQRALDDPSLEVSDAPGLPLSVPSSTGLWPQVQDPVVDALAYLPVFVRDRLTDDLSKWLKEVRRLTMVFAAIEGLAEPALLQQRAAACLAVVDGQAGQLLRFGLEGRTLVAEIAFGLALGPRAAGATEALHCAATLARAIPRCRVGVSTGRVLLGPIGSPARLQLTLLGSAVNLAARLMQQAGEGDVLVDDATWSDAGQRRFHGEQLHAVLKGLGERSYHRMQSARAKTATPELSLFGRDAECAAAQAALGEALQPARPIVIEGEAGIGKSRLARWLAGELRAHGTRVWTAMCTPVGRDTPYASLMPVISELCGLVAGAADVGTLEAVAADVLGDVARAGLLRDALGLSSATAVASADVSGHVRADNIREALLALFAAVDQYAALVVEDAHWLDSTSWLLLQRIATEVHGVRLVIVMRPLAREEPAPLQSIRAWPSLELDLRPLDEADVVAVVADHLHVSEVPGALARWIVERARGNPFFAQELASMLGTVATLMIREGRVVQAPSAAELEALPVAPTIESTIEQRIDRLGVYDAVVLKLASVIGAGFNLDELAELGGRGDRAALAPAVDRLVSADMAVQEGPGRYAFRHRYTQEAAYRMLPSDQRRELHGRVADWLERRYSDRAEERAGDLAHHWYCAERWSQAADWLERAGRRALGTGADSEAAAHFRRALSLSDGQSIGRRATWHRSLAQALFGLGQVEGVAAEARRAFELVAHPLPSGAAGWTGLALTTAGRRIAGGALPRRTGKGDPQRRRDQLEGARAAALLAESAYFVNAPEMMLASALLAVDMAERTALAAPVSTAYGMLAVVLGMARMHRTAERYLARARVVAEEAGDIYQQGVAWFYAGIYHGCLGDWEASLRASQRGLAITDSLGAYMLSGRQLTVIATNALYTSDYEHTRTWMQTMRTRAERLANVQQVGWAGNVVSVADLHQARYADAIAHAERSREIFLHEHDPISMTISEGVRCAALARSGQMDAALEGADRATRLITGARPTTWGQLEGFAGPCEVYAVALARRLQAPQTLRARMAPAMAALRLFAFVFPFGRARYHWLCGQVAMSCGRPSGAHRHLRAALEAARRFGMPYEEWRATELLAALPQGEAHRPQLQALQQRVIAGAAVQALQTD